MQSPAVRGIDVSDKGGGRASGEPTIRINGWFAPEDAALNDQLGSLVIANATGNWLGLITYTFVGTNHDGNRVAISADTIRRGATALNFEDHPSLDFEIQADNGIDLPITAAFSRPVTNVLEVTLNALTLNDNNIRIDVPNGTAVGDIVGKSAGSTLTILTVDDFDKFALDGVAVDKAAVLVEGTYSITVREIHPDGINSPRDTTFTINALPAYKTDLAAGAFTIAGQTAAFVKAAPGNYVTGLNVGIFTITGETMDPEVAYKTNMDVGQFTYTGQSADFVHEGAPPFEAETITLLAAMTDPPHALRQANINALIVALKTAGIWADLDVFYVMAAHDAQAAKLNWKNPGTKDLIEVNTLNFTVDMGFQSNGSNSRARTQYVPSTDGVQYLQDDAAHFIYSRTDADSTVYDSGTVTAPQCRIRKSSSLQAIFNDATLHTKGSAVSGIGLLMVQRRAAADVRIFRNGVQLGTTDTTASTGRPATEQWLCGANSSQFSSRLESAGGWGASLVGQELALYNALNTYMTNILIEVPEFWQIGEDYWASFGTIIEDFYNNDAYDTATFNDFGLDLSATNKYVGSVLGPNGKIYCVPRTGTDCLIINTATDTAVTTNFGLDLSGASKWAGGVLAENGKIYCIPSNSAFVLVINTADDTAVLEDFGLTLTDTAKWVGGVLGPDGKVYGVPLDANDFLIIDPDANTAVRDDLGATLAGGTNAVQYEGAVVGANGLIYCIPLNAPNIAVIDTATGTCTLEDFGLDLSAALKWVGGVLAPNGKIYCIPYDADEFLIIDTVNNTAALDALGATLTGTAKWSAGALGSDGLIYGAPRNAVDFVRINPETDAADRPTFGLSLTGNTKYESATLAPNGKLYFAPRGFPDAIILTTGAAVNADIALSGHLNKF